MYAADELHGLNWMFPAFATEDATDINSTDTIAVDNMRDAINKGIDDGVDVISLMGSYGECHTLLFEEFQTIVKAAVEFVDDRVPLMVGVTSINSREVVRKARFARDVGAQAIFVGVPHYYPPTVDNAIEFYREICELFPDLSVQIYHNPTLHHIHIPVRAFPELIKNKNIVSMKDSHRSPLEFMKLQDIVRGKISMFVNQSQYYPYHHYGARGFWSTDAAMGPWPLLALRNAVDAGDEEAAKQVLRDISPGGGGEGGDFTGPQDNARKLGAAYAGYCDPGPNRPPFVLVSPQSLERAIKRAEAWKTLCAKYRPIVEAARQEPAPVG